MELREHEGGNKWNIREIIRNIKKIRGTIEKIKGDIEKTRTQFQGFLGPQAFYHPGSP